MLPIYKSLAKYVIAVYIYVVYLHIGTDETLTYWRIDKFVSEKKKNLGIEDYIDYINKEYLII